MSQVFTSGSAEPDARVALSGEMARPVTWRVRWASMVRSNTTSAAFCDVMGWAMGVKVTVGVWVKSGVGE